MRKANPSNLPALNTGNSCPSKATSTLFFHIFHPNAYFFHWCMTKTNGGDILSLGQQISVFIVCKECVKTCSEFIQHVVSFSVVNTRRQNYKLLVLKMTFQNEIFRAFFFYLSSTYVNLFFVDLALVFNDAYARIFKFSLEFKLLMVKLMTWTIFVP